MKKKILIILSSILFACIMFFSIVISSVNGISYIRFENAKALADIKPLLACHESDCWHEDESLCVYAECEDCQCLFMEDHYPSGIAFTCYDF